MANFVMNESPRVSIPTLMTLTYMLPTTKHNQSCVEVNGIKSIYGTCTIQTQQLSRFLISLLIHSAAPHAVFDHLDEIFLWEGG